MTSEGTLVDLDFGDTSSGHHGGTTIVTSNGLATPILVAGNGSLGNDVRSSETAHTTLLEKVNQLSLLSGAHEPQQQQSPASHPTSSNGERDVQDAIVSDLLLPCTLPLFGAAADNKQSVNHQSSSRLPASSASTVATTVVDVGDGTPLVLPDVSFEGITLDSGIDRESQPLLGSRDHEITYNQFPGKCTHSSLSHPVRASAVYG
uniref:Uncharacterized protein n=1 Tax=Anopheles maculatus TaxID=74869 RepID=A0A182SEM8_9DIPT